MTDLVWLLQKHKKFFKNLFIERPADKKKKK